MDVKYINPFMKAIKNVFGTMLSIEVTFGKPRLRTEAEASHDVSGIIGLSGDAMGAVILSFPKPAALKIAGAFAGITFKETDEDFADAIGELANMVAGSAKRDLEGLNISISVPSVIIGQNHQVKATRMVPRLIIPCSTPLGSFVVEVGMKVLKQNTNVESPKKDSTEQELVASTME